MGVARNLLRPVGRSFQLTYAVYNTLCWSVANWKGAAAVVWDSKLADSSLQIEYLGEIIKQLLTDSLLASDKPIDTWAQVATTLCAAVKLLSAAAAPLCTPSAASMRELQMGGANGVAALGGAAVDLQSGAWFALVIGIALEIPTSVIPAIPGLPAASLVRNSSGNSSFAIPGT